MQRLAVALILVLIGFAGVLPARGEEAGYTLAIKGQAFEPLEIDVPAGQKLILTVKNLDATPAEFESSDLNREKVVPGGSAVTVFIGPLRPGSYEFFDDFNAATPHGHIVAK